MLRATPLDTESPFATFPTLPWPSVGDALLLSCTVLSVGLRAWCQLCVVSPDLDGCIAEISDKEEAACSISPLHLVTPSDSQDSPESSWPSATRISDRLVDFSVQLAPPTQQYRGNFDGAPSSMPTDDDARTAEATAITFSGAAPLMETADPDPLQVLFDCLTLEEKLSIAVDWFSLVSNFLTYSLRLSQVLYSFIFTNGDFVLFVTTHSNQFRRRHHRPRMPCRSTAPDMPLTSFTAGNSEEGYGSQEAVVAAMTDVRGSYASSPCPRSGATPAAAASTLPHTFVVEASGTASSAVMERLQRGEGAVVGACGAPTAVARGPHFTKGFGEAAKHQMRLPVEVCDPHSARRWCRPRLAIFLCIRRASALMKTRLTCLLILNAVFTLTLLVFHVHHLFSWLGAFSGYLAAVISVFLCGMELGCILLRLWRRCRSFCHSRHLSRLSADTWASHDGDNKDPTRRIPACPTDAEVPGGAASSSRAGLLSGIIGSRVAYLGQHLTASACAALYFWMLLGEGRELWSSHVGQMRWHVCSLAAFVLSLLKCLRIVF